ncbi:MAG TPA: type II secretion system protein GspM [Solirubrobacteraceae bacterium]|nr:type II secretion system protein GspM [Solirubrobacteraceae bacterium]
MTARDRTVILVVVAVAAIVAGWFFMVSPKRNQASSLSSQISSEQSQLDTVSSQVAAGKAAQTAFAGQYAQLARLGEAVPPDDDVPSLIYQVQSAAQVAGVTFTGLQLNPNSSTPSSSSSSGSSGSSSTNGVSTSSLPPGAGVGAAGLPTENFTFTLEGNFFHLANFFNRLENFVISRDNQLVISGRLMSLNAISLAPGGNGFPQINATISATTYIVPATEGPFDGATPAGPSPTPQTQASTSGSSTSTAAPAAAITSVVR